MSDCPCGSNNQFESCCEPYLAGKANPPTAEALMRSRYSAFALANIQYLTNTVSDAAAKRYNPSRTKKWASSITWLGLAILKTEQGGPDDDIGWVEFIASYRDKQGDNAIHERSEFKKIKGKWHYTNGEHFS